MTTWRLDKLFERQDRSYKVLTRSEPRGFWLRLTCVEIWRIGTIAATPRPLYGRHSCDRAELVSTLLLLPRVPSTYLDTEYLRACILVLSPDDPQSTTSADLGTLIDIVFLDFQPLNQMLL